MHPSTRADEAVLAGDVETAEQLSEPEQAVTLESTPVYAKAATFNADHKKVAFMDMVEEEMQGHYIEVADEEFDREFKFSEAPKLSDATIKEAQACLVKDMQFGATKKIKKEVDMYPPTVSIRRPCITVLRTPNLTGRASSAVSCHQYCSEGYRLRREGYL